MQILQTATEALDTSEIDRIAYLRPPERAFLKQATGRSDTANPGQGEVIIEMGDAIVTLSYVDSELEGRLIVRNSRISLHTKSKTSSISDELSRKLGRKPPVQGQKLTRKQCTIETAASAEGTRSAAP